MLEFIRRSASSAGFKILAGVLACTFLFCFGMFDVINRWTGKDYVVKIGKIKITPALFSLEKAKKLNMLRARQKNIDEKSETNNILHQIIQNSIINQAFSDFGFSISDNTIKKYTAGIDIFRDENGRFNLWRFRKFLQNINISEPMFLEFVEKDIKNALIKTPLQYVSPYKTLDSYVKANLEKRALAIVEIDPRSIKISEKPTQEDLETFYAQNQDLFLVKETRSFRVIALNADTVAKKITVSEEEVEDFYKTSPERGDRAYNEMKNEIKADILQNKLQRELDDETRLIEDALMSGENIDNVIKRFNLESVKVKNIAIDQKKLFDNENIFTAAHWGKAFRSLVKSDYFKNILTAAFSVEEEADSSFADTTVGAGRNRLFWFVHVDSVFPKHAAEFNSVKDKINKEWLKKKQRDEAVKLAEIFCKAGENLSALALRNSKKVFFTKPFDKDGNFALEKGEKKNDRRIGNALDENRIMKIASKFTEEFFLNDQRSPVYKEIDGKIVVAQVNKIIPAENISDKQQAKFYMNLAKDMLDDLYQQMIGYLSKERYEIKINSELLEKTGADTSQVNEMF